MIGQCEENTNTLQMQNNKKKYRLCILRQKRFRNQVQYKALT